MNPKSYDPTVAFMFFREWVEAIDELERVTDKHRMFKAIADYSMYGEEPDFGDSAIMRGMWRLIVSGIDASVKNRQKGFAKDELNGNYVKVKEALQQNPMASLREIAEVTGVSKSTVERVKRKLERAETFTSALSPTPVPTPVPTPTPNPTSNPTSIPTYSPNPSYSMGRDSGTVPHEGLTNDAVPSLDDNKIDQIIDEAAYDEKQYQSVKDVLQCDPSLYEYPRQIENETGIDIDIVMMICSRLDKEGFIRICRERVKENAATAKYAAARAAQVDDVDCIDEEETGPIYNDTDDISDEGLPF